MHGLAMLVLPKFLLFVPSLLFLKTRILHLKGITSLGKYLSSFASQILFPYKVDLDSMEEP